MSTVWTSGEEALFASVGGQPVGSGSGNRFYGAGPSGWNFGLFSDPRADEVVRSRFADRNAGAQSFYDAAPHLIGYGVGRSINLHAIARAVVSTGIRSQYQNRGTCVSRGAKRIVDLVQCLAIYAGAPHTFQYASHAYIYGTCREHGNYLSNQDGAVGAWAAWSVSHDGNLVNEDCNDSDNDDALAVKWGASGVPDSYKTKGRLHLVKEIVPLKSSAEVRDFLCAGLGGVTVASSVGFTMTRDSNGVCRASGRWDHQMCYTGYDGQNNRFAQDQSWGPGVPGGPLFNADGQPFPDYTFGVEESDVSRQVSAGDTFGYKWVDGWNPVNLTWRP